MLASKPSQFGRVRANARDVATHQLEHRRMHCRVSLRSDMADAGGSRPCALDEGQRAGELAHRPESYRQEEQRADARIMAEAEGEVVVPARLEQGERAFQMIPRFAVLPG